MTLRRVDFELTSRCNLDCKHCMREQGEERDLPLDLIKRVLSEAGDRYGIRETTFTGGEPLLYPRFEELLQFLGDHDFQFSMVTNGLLVPRFMEVFKHPGVKRKLDYVALSLDGADESAHDQVRGKGVYRKVIRSMVLLREAGIPVYIKFTIGGHNCQVLERSLLELSHLKPARIEVSHVFPTPDNVEAGLVLGPSEWRTAESAVLRMAQELKTPVVMTAPAYSPLKFHSCIYLDMSNLYIDAKGRLCLCCLLPGIRGRDPERVEGDVIADLANTTLCEAHADLIKVIHGFQTDRLQRMAKDDIPEADHFQCIACARYFGKLDWLQYCESPWK